MNMINEDGLTMQEQKQRVPAVCPTCGLAVRPLMEDVAAQFAQFGMATAWQIQLLRSHFNMCCTKEDA